MSYRKFFIRQLPRVIGKGNNGRGRGPGNGGGNPAHGGPGIPGPGAWTTKASMGTQRSSLQGAGVSNSSAFAMGGNNAASSSPSHYVTCETWDGSSWTAGGNAANERSRGGSAGTPTAGLVWLGDNSAAFKNSTETYNGSAWSAGGAPSPSNSQYPAGGGTNTAAISICAGAGTTTYTYNGSAWSAGGNTATARNKGMGGGTTTSAIIAGGETGPASSAEKYNGSAWSSAGNMATARYAGGDGASANTSAINFGGLVPALSAIATTYDGVSWSVKTAMALARKFLAGAGNLSGALSFGGDTGTGLPSSVTESFAG